MDNVPYTPEWQWQLKHKDSSWYPTMRLFRQNKRDDWGNVFDQIHRELSKLLFYETTIQNKFVDNSVNAHYNDSKSTN